MKRLDPEITVILPCAGSGSRLGLDTPKELYEIFPGVRLIDFSIRHIQAFISACESGVSLPLKVVVVTRPWKVQVSEYVQSQLPQVEVRTVFFNERYHDWPGSIYSAAGDYSGHNIVLLPDSFLAVSDGDPFHDSSSIPLILALTRKLSFSDLVFGAVFCADPVRLRHLGALYVEEQTVKRFYDKPDTDFHLYNSFWGCYGFTRSIGASLYEFMVASVSKQFAPRDLSPPVPAAAIQITGYRDLGTWSAIDAFRAEWSSENNWSK
jgi:hypothetical protein